MRALCACGVMVALSVVLGGPPFAFRWSIGALPALQVSFQLTPVALSGFLFGPMAGLIAGAASDLIRSLLFPMGAYVPWFTVAYALLATTPSLLCRILFKKDRQGAYAYLQIALGFLIAQGLFSALVNTLLISWLYGGSFIALLPTRLAGLAMAPVHAFVVKGLIGVLRRTRVVSL